MMDRSLHHPRPAIQTALLVVALALVAGAVFLTFVVAAATRADGDDRAPRCTTVSSKGGGDFVPAGTRPCTLYGTGHVPTGNAGAELPGQPDAGANTSGGASAKVPAAPKVAAPPKVASPPKVSLSKR
ncbi:hypothetical protein [Streptomyces chrestomyceticus]|uniref:hypothetical protein n=1 Tax=Streptomyces chrestomyceticus TaxID=68185 RepID=UPI003400EA33